MSDLQEVFTMWGTVGAKLGTVALATLAIGLAACGGDDGDETTAPGAASDAQSRAENLDRFLMRRDEQPGFRLGAGPEQVPASGGTVTGVDAFVKEMPAASADAERLRGEGFISFTYQPTRGARTAGITNATLYKTAAGAKHSMAHDLRRDVISAEGPVAKLRYFTVSGVPGARGYTASLPGQPASQGIGNVLWVQGRCMLVLGNQGPGPFVGPLSEGARAIHQRTNGECP